ncbi:unnamed protein product, partial [Heterotrigona itama]
ISIQLYYSDEFKKKVTNYCIRFGHSLWSANHLPAQEVNLRPKIAIFSQFQYNPGKTIIINLLLRNFYPVIYHIDEIKKEATNYCIRFGHSLWSANQLPAQEVNLRPKIAIFSQFQVYLSITQAKQIISLLLHNFYPVIYRTDEFKKKVTNYCIRFGHSLWSANQLPAQGVKENRRRTSERCQVTVRLQLRNLFRTRMTRLL